MTPKNLEKSDAIIAIFIIVDCGLIAFALYVAFH